MDTLLRQDFVDTYPSTFTKYNELKDACDNAIASLFEESDVVQSSAEYFYINPIASNYTSAEILTMYKVIIPYLRVPNAPEKDIESDINFLKNKISDNLEYTPSVKMDVNLGTLTFLCKWRVTKDTLNQNKKDGVKYSSVASETDKKDAANTMGIPEELKPVTKAVMM